MAVSDDNDVDNDDGVEERDEVRYDGGRSVKGVGSEDPFVPLGEIEN